MLYPSAAHELRGRMPSVHAIMSPKKVVLRSVGTCMSAMSARPGTLITARKKTSLLGGKDGIPGENKERSRGWGAKWDNSELVAVIRRLLAQWKLLEHLFRSMVGAISVEPLLVSTLDGRT